MKTLGMTRKYPSIVFIGLLSGLTGVASFFVVTPDFAAKFISPNGYITEQGLIDLDYCRLLSLIAGCYLLIRSVMVGVRLVGPSFTEFRKSMAGASTEGTPKPYLGFALRCLVRLVMWCSFLLVSFFVIYTIYYIVADANWVFGDEHLLLTSTLVGKPTESLIVPSTMRFAPLGFEYDILIPFGNAPYVYYSWESLKFLIIVIATLVSMLVVAHSYLKVDEEVLSILKSAANFMVMGLIVSPGLFFVVSEVITMEPLQMVFVSLFILFYLLALKIQSLKSFLLISSFACGTLAFYCKEPTFGAVLIAVSPPLLLSWRSIDKRTRTYYISMVVSCLCFLLMFYIFIIRPRGSLEGGYHVGRLTDFSFAKYLSFLVYYKFWLILLAIPITAYRLLATVFCLATKRRIDPDLLIFDGLMYGGLAYAFSFFLLGIMEVHYFVPSFVFIVPAAFYYYSRLVVLVQRSSPGRWIALFVAVTLPTIYTVHTFDIYDWQQEHVGKCRRTHTPALQAILPELERSHLVLVVPEMGAFASEFEKTAVLHWEYYTIIKFVEFLSAKELTWNIYDPDRVIDETWLHALDGEVVHSLDQLSDDRGVMAVLASFALKGEAHEELCNDSEVAETMGLFPVTFRRITR